MSLILIIIVLVLLFGGLGGGAETLRSTIGELMAGQAMMAEIHRELAVPQHDAHAAKQAIAELRRAEAARKDRGRLARLRAAWRE